MFKEFNKYVNNFDISDDKIMHKIEHSIRVSKKMKEYAYKLGFSKDEILLASEIGLLHDIGRFHQVEVQNSYSDLEGLDHADYGVKFLFDDGNISKFVKDEKHYPAIRFAIKNHNKLTIEKCDDIQILKQAKLIRDIDKLDILYSLGKRKVFNRRADDSKISQKVMASFLEKRCVNVKDIKTKNDDVAYAFGLVFDINNDMCTKEIKDYLTAYYKQINNEEKFKEIYDICLNYLDERMK